MEIVQQIFTTIIGFVMVGGLLAFMYKRFAVDWKKLHAAYGRDWSPPMEQKRFQTLILYSEGRPAKSYKGLMTIGLHPDGIGIRPLIWLAPFHSPLFIPYSDIEGWKQKWFLDAKSMELAFRKTPAMRLIMPADQVAWISSQAKGSISLSEDYPSHSNWPWATFAYALLSGIVAIFLIVMVFSNPDFQKYFENYKSQEIAADPTEK